MADADNRNPLTKRQVEVLELVAQGVTNKEIGRALDISEHTVRKHLQNIFEKLEASSRTEATTLAYQRGWVTLGPSDSANESQGRTAGAELAPARGVRIDPRLLAAAGVAGAAVVVLLVWLVFTRQPPRAAGGPRANPADMDRWAEATPLSVPRTGLAATAFKGSLYAIAGETPSGPTALAERLDPDNDTWERLADKPTPVRDAGAAVVGGNIYVPGGCLEDGTPTGVVEVYDPEADTWTGGAGMPRGLCAYAIAALEGDIYVFGGWDGTGYTDDVFTYDPDQDTWSEATPMLSARGYAGAAAVEGQIYVVGGYDGRGAMPVVEAYSPSNDQGSDTPWIKHKPLPDARAGAGVVTVRSWLYIVGGGWDAGRETAIQYDVRSDTWTLFPNPTSERWRNMGTTVLDTQSETRIYALGGLEDDEYIAANRTYTAFYNVILPLQQR